MKLTAVVVTFALVITIGSPAFADRIQDVPWNESNVGTLREFDRALVEKFVNQMSGGDPVHRTVGQFAWMDLAGDRRFELVATLDLSGRGFFDYLAIYRRDDAGKVTTQWFKGETAVGKVSDAVRDLNGDGRDELIIPKVFPPGTYGADAVMAVWPDVYELKDARYVEAAKKFAELYDSEVLPDLDRKITKTRARIASEPQYSQRLFALTLERDKILRVLGRSPAAGLEEARAWVRRDNPNLVRAGLGVLEDVGGHEDEVSAARDALNRSLAQHRGIHQGI